MNEQEVFRKIVLGLKFDEQKFTRDAERFKKPSIQQFDINDIQTNNKLDFFKTLKSSLETKSYDNYKQEEEGGGEINNIDLIDETNETNSVDYVHITETKFPNEDSAAENNTINQPTTIKVNQQNLRKLYRIYVEGTDIPQLITTFNELHSFYGFNKICLQNVLDIFKFTTLTPIQMQAIPAMLHGREILACAPTGSGKTLAFLIPAIHHIFTNNMANMQKKSFRVLILSPTKELAEQTFRICRQLLKPKKIEKKQLQKKLLLRVKLLDKKEIKIFNSAGPVHSKKMDILISTPKRLIYLLKRDTPMISLENVEWLIVDESDKLFEEGAGSSAFRDQLGCIYAACTNPKIRRAMFSATFAFDVQQWCILNMDNVLQVTVGGKNTAVDTIKQELQYVGTEPGKLLALRQIMQQGFSPPVLLFVQSKERAKELFAELIYYEKNVDVIHSERTSNQRENAIKCFRRGDTWLLICTELLGRGIDFKGVNLVINYDFPTSAISYIHRIGRTGRAGRPGRAVTFFTDDDKPLLRTIANVVRQAGCDIPEYMLKMKKTPKSDLKKLKRKQIKRRAITAAPCDSDKKKMKKENVLKNRQNT